MRRLNYEEKAKVLELIYKTPENKREAFLQEIVKNSDALFSQRTLNGALTGLVISGIFNVIPFGEIAKCAECVDYVPFVDTTEIATNLAQVPIIDKTIATISATSFGAFIGFLLEKENINTIEEIHKSLS